jgi:hypothetical protein
VPPGSLSALSAEPEEEEEEEEAALTEAEPAAAPALLPAAAARATMAPVEATSSLRLKVPMAAKYCCRASEHWGEKVPLEGAAGAAAAASAELEEEGR